jgi:uncharacterized protein YndB with AHSA1/START domain
MANSTRSIDLHEKIHATPQEIFPYLVKQEKLIQWFPTRAETDPVVGGHYMLAFEFSDAAMAEKGNHIRRGEFKRIHAPKAVEYSWEVSDTDVSFELNSTGGETDIHLIHSGWAANADEEAYQSHLRGWMFFLSNLKTLLESKQDRRSDEMWLKTAK